MATSSTGPHHLQANPVNGKIGSCLATSRASSPSSSSVLVSTPSPISLSRLGHIKKPLKNSPPSRRHLLLT
ncbi:hypothetical protein Gotri_019835, partial [Gossypium trilobum]|nr:hypothetical protein [Gossypium trilobum]